MKQSVLVFAGSALIAACAPAPAPTTAPSPQAAATGGLYMPRDVKAAFRKERRSPDGRPGPAYWQNRGRYNIAITALPPDRTVRGNEQITYFNNSPDTLRNPVIKLFLNIHKPGAPRAGGASADYLTSGVHIDTVIVNGQPTPWPGVENAFTNFRLRLPTPLLPHDSVRLAFRWHFNRKMPA